MTGEEEVTTIKTDEEKPSEEEKSTKTDEEKPSEEEIDVVTFGKEATPEPAAPWVKALRVQNRELNAEIRKLKKGAEKTIEESIGPEPTIDGCDLDAEKYAVEFKKWLTKKEAVSKRQNEETVKQQKEKDDWQKKLAVHGEKKAALNIPDYEDAEESFVESFSDIQQSLIVETADNSAVVIYALGSNPEKAKELAAITNHAKFVAAMSKMETQMTVTKRSPGTEPEKKTDESGTPTKPGESALDKLREEAVSTKDLSKVHAYRKAHPDEK